MLHFIKEIIDIHPFKVVCIFNYGEKRMIDLSDLIKNKINSKLYQQLADDEYFSSVKLDSYGTLYWDNGLDFCPDVLFEISEPINEVI